MAKPTLKPRWATTVTADPTRYVEPPAGKKDIGWDVGERPPAQYENWLRGTTGQWIDWLDTFESTPHTWTATQTFTPSTAVPGVILGYNSATDTANETPSLAFKAGSSTRGIIDRLGAPSQRWLRREFGWWGNINSPSTPTGDELLDGEVGIWRRTSGPGVPANIFNVAVLASDTGGSWAGGPRELLQQSSFGSVANQYHVCYTDSLYQMAPVGTKSVACDFTARVDFITAPNDAISAIGLMQRGVYTLPGLGGRDILVSSQALSVATALLYGGKWQVLHRVGGVTTITDTGILSNTRRNIRLEIVADTSLGGPRTNVYIDGVNVYSTTTIHPTDVSYAFTSLHKPISAGGSVDTYLGPVRLLFGPI
jgi:hypothetical protein